LEGNADSAGSANTADKGAPHYLNQTASSVGPICLGLRPASPQRIPMAALSAMTAMSALSGCRR